MKSRSPLFSLVFTVIIDLLGVGIIIPILAPLFQSSAHLLPSNASDTTRTVLMGLLFATFPLFQFFGAPLLGSLSDRYGRKKLLLISLGGTLVGYILFAIGILKSWVWLLFIGRALDGFTGGNISIVQSAIADISKPEDRAKNFGLIGMAFGIGFVFGPVIGGIMSDSTIHPWFTFATPFIAAAVLTFINIILVSLRLQETLLEKKEKATFKNPLSLIWQAFANPTFQLLFLTSFLFTLGFTSFTQFFQVFLIKKFSYTQSQIGYLFAFIGICIALTQGLLTRRVGKKYQPEQILTVSILGTALFVGALAFVQAPWQIFVLIPFFASMNGLTTPNMSATISRKALPSEQGLIMGMSHAVQAMGQTLPAALLGWLVAKNASNALYAASLFIAVAWSVFLLQKQRQQKTT